MEVMALNVTKEYISIRELAKKLGVHTITVRKTVAKQIPSYAFGRKIYFKIEDVEAWIKAQKKIHEGEEGASN